MPFVANTPESLLARNDSKRPDATCRGITSNGRPCRRPVSPPRTPVPASKKKAALQATPLDEDGSLFCWQHKEQAKLSASSSRPASRRPSVHGAIPEEAGRSSLDTLADRLGLVDLNAKDYVHDVVGGRHGDHGDRRRKSNRTESRRKNREPKSRLFCFCFTIPEEPQDPSPRPHRPRPGPNPVQPPATHQPSRPSTSSVPAAGTPTRPSSKQPSSQSQQQHLSASHADSSPGKQSYRSSKSAKSTVSSTTAAHLKALIPDSLDITTTSTLMSELVKPPTDADEPGYIYMFWLTPESASTPAPVDAARDLLAPPPRGGGGASQRRSSDVVSSFAQQNAKSSKSSKNAAEPSKTMLLKIGRAANVQRRMNQWSRQCGHSIQMLRYYPYVSSSSSSTSPSPSRGGASSSDATPHMTPHCKKVERLIHLELAGLGLRADMGACEACGREHREWFEVDASREGIRRVDEVIRRWIGWDENGGTVNSR